MLKAVLHSHQSLQKIFICFLISGYSFLPKDSDFSDVKCALRHQQRMYLPDDYMRVIKYCRKKIKFQVTRMVSTEFYSNAKLEQQINNLKFDINKKKISWLQTREIFLDREKPFSLYMKNNFNDEQYVKVDIRKKHAGRPAFFKDMLIPMWPTGKKISAPKLQDIKSIMHLIPFDCKPFYKNLYSDETLEDYIDSFNGSPDFGVEY